MSINKKVFLIIGMVLFVLSSVITIYVAANFKDYGHKTARNNAVVLAGAVRDGLTAHMVNGIMDKREYYLSNIVKNQDIENIKIVRSNSVISQYGKGKTSESEYDALQSKVLNTGKEESVVIEKNGKKFLRIAIPYMAGETSSPNCIDCHTAKIGDVLGAISMDVSLEETIKDGIDIVTKLAIFAVVFLVAAILVANYYIKPYITLFDDLEEGISKAYHGDFSYNIKTKLSGEAASVAHRLNELSNIFLFKKTIEGDKDRQTIINRLLYIFKDKFKIENISIFEIDKEAREKTKIYSNKRGVEKLQKFISADCRADRLRKDMFSTDFANICAECMLDNKEYICLPFTLSDKKNLILNIEFESKEESMDFRENLPIVKNLIETARPVLETKILMEILEESSLKDSLTNLYNRRFLENFLSQNSHNKSIEYAIVMLDVDFFKQVNDGYGHDVGDKVIKAVGSTIKNNIKGSDFGVRYGGEEFLILLFDVNRDIAFKIAEQIRNEFSMIRFEAGAVSFNKTLSAGVAVYNIDARSHWQTIKFADEALYHSKQNGRNQTTVFDKSMHSGEENY